MRLLLLRHGQTIDNVHGALGTVVPGPGLTELGHRQAAAVPAALAGETIDAIYISTMRRTRETAEPLASALGLPLNQIDGLQEISAGELEQRSDADAITAYMGTILHWWTTLDARIPGGEDGHEFSTRYSGAIESIVAAHPDTPHRAATVVVVSHGAAIRAFTSFACANVDAAFSRSHPLENTGVVIVEGSPADGWNVTHWADEPIGGADLEDALAPDPTADA